MGSRMMWSAAVGVGWTLACAATPSPRAARPAPAPSALTPALTSGPALPSEVARWRVPVDCDARSREYQTNNPGIEEQHVERHRRECVLNERVREYVAAHQACDAAGECQVMSWGCLGAAVRREYADDFEETFGRARAELPIWTCCGAGPPPQEATCRSGYCIPMTVKSRRSFSRHFED